MPQINRSNERRKRAHIEHLKWTDRKSKVTVSGAAKALRRFEDHTGFADFANLDRLAQQRSSGRLHLYPHVGAESPTNGRRVESYYEAYAFETKIAELSCQPTAATPDEGPQL